MAETTKLWCDGPFELISVERAGVKGNEEPKGAEKMAKEMIIVHNVMIRGINCVHRQAARVANEGTAQDKLDFANFAAQWGQMLHHHHDLEETTIFPRFCKEVGDPNLMKGPLAEHREFDEGLERYAAYLKEVKEGREELDGGKLRAIVDEVIPAVHRHLVHEIDELLSLGKYDHVDWEALFEELVQAAANTDMKHSWYRTDLFPLVLHLHDKTYEGGAFSSFPPVPWIVLLGIRWIFCRTRANWWRFAGCDGTSMPQELPFADAR